MKIKIKLQLHYLKKKKVYFWSQNKTQAVPQEVL